MRTDDKLISVIVTSYNNFEYIFECLDSIVGQTYPNIEVIVTDDGSNDFIKEKLEAWFQLYSGNNLKNIVINQIQYNLGTVKNVNAGLKLANGDVITMIAADDKYNGNKVFSLAMRQFELLPDDALVLTTQVDMCDQLMSAQNPFMNERVLNTLMFGSVMDLLKLELIGSLLPSCGTYYKKEVFERFGLCDERFDLIEDHVLHLKLLKAGVRFYYLNVTTVSHRSGGVSHGTKDMSKSVRFWVDCLNVIEHEILPLVDVLLDENEKQEALAVYENTKVHYQAAIGEAVPIKQVLTIKRSALIGMLTAVTGFLVPRVRVLAKYMLVLGFALCCLPSLISKLTIPIFAYTIVTVKAPFYGGILIITAVMIAIFSEIPLLIVKFFSVKRKLSKYQIARFFDAILGGEADE